MLLVDAFNVLHAADAMTPDVAGIGLDELHTLIAASRYRSRPLTLVCDGPGPASPASAIPSAARRIEAGVVRLVYAGAGSDADSVIERMLSESSGARRWLVVSSDRRVQRAATRRRASVLSAQVFLRQLETDRSRPRPPAIPAFAADLPLDAQSTAWWMREFGYACDAPAALPRDTVARPRGLADAAGAPTGLPDAAATQPPSPPASGPAAEEWPGRLTVDDLDMQRWLELYPPPSSPRSRSRRRR